MNIKPIDTVYNGYRFRSRLEARWAVFFDTLKIKYQYETEGFELPDGSRYLPDFYLESCSTYVEIKPGYSGVEPRQKLALLAKHTMRNAILLEGSPSISEWEWNGPFQDVTQPREYALHYFVGTTRDVMYHFAEHYLEDGFYSLQELLQDNGYNPPEFDGGMRRADELIEIDKAYYLAKYGKPHPNWTYGLSFPNLCFEDANPNRDWFNLRLSEGNDKVGCQIVTIDSDRIIAAMKKARQARFEHGETGQ